MTTIRVLGKEYTAGLVIFDKDGTLIDFRRTGSTHCHALECPGEYVPMNAQLRSGVQERSALGG